LNAIGTFLAHHLSVSIPYSVMLLCWFILPVSATAQENIKVASDTTEIVGVLDTLTIGAYFLKGDNWQTPGSISQLRGNQLVLADNTNLTTVINTLPGVTMQTGTYATNRIVIRGMGSRTPFNTNRIRSYINDIPITGNDGISNPEEIDVQGLGRLEIIKGPASALYGSGLGGTINFYTPSVEKQYSLQATAQYGSFGTSRLHLSGGISKGGFKSWTAVNRMDAVGFRENNHFTRTSILNHSGYYGKNWSIEFTGIWLSMDAGIPSSIGSTLFQERPTAAAPNWLAIEGFKNLQRAIAGFTYTQDLGGGWVNKSTIFTRWSDNYEKRPFNNLDDGSTGIGWRNTLSKYGSRWDYIIGFEGIQESYEWMLDINDRTINNNKEVRQQGNIFGVIYFRPSKRWVLTGAFAMNAISYQLIDQFPLNGDQSGQRVFPTVWSPRAGFSYQIASSWQWYGSMGHGFSMPSPEETLLEEGSVNTQIKAEQGWQYETGIRWRKSPQSWQVDWVVYHINLNNLLVTKRLTEDIFTGLNAGRTHHWGLELAVEGYIMKKERFPGRLSNRWSIAMSANRFIEFEDDGVVFDGNALPGIPQETVQALFDWRPWPFFTLMCQYQFTGAQWINDANTFRYEGFNQINLQGSFHLYTQKQRSGRLYIGVNNALDSRHASMLVINALAPMGQEPRYFYPALPRHFFVGFTGVF
jgi:iron complex outermembrane receptor protein